MSALEKRLEKFMKRPPPKDITLDEVAYIAVKLGFEISSGGKHPLRITHPDTQVVFPVPEKNGLVKSFYITKLQEWFNEMKLEGNE